MSLLRYLESLGLHPSKGTWHTRVRPLGLMTGHIVQGAGGSREKHGETFERTLPRTLYLTIENNTILQATLECRNYWTKGIFFARELSAFYFSLNALFYGKHQSRLQVKEAVQEDDQLSAETHSSLHCTSLNGIFPVFKLVMLPRKD